MTDQENLTSKKPRIHWIKKTLAVSACVVFLFSILFPFLQITYWPLLIYFNNFPPPLNSFQFSRSAWTFMSQLDSGNPNSSRVGSQVYWFYEKGFYDYIPGPRFYLIFIFMIIVQTLTLATGVLFTVKGRSIHALTGLILAYLLHIM